MNPDEHWLDGYRLGLGAAIHAIERLRTLLAIPTLADTICAQAGGETTPETVNAVLGDIANGLRKCSAATRLADQ